jgi:hypothetical protein
MNKDMSELRFWCDDKLIDIQRVKNSDLNKQFKRRTKPMEIVAGENVCYTLLAFICLKMELHWKSNPIGKVRKNLPFLKELEDKKFTQKT